MAWQDDINATGAKTRLSRSTVVDGVVEQSPAALFEQAQRVLGAGPRVTLDRYTLARIIASELGDGTPVEQACIGDADLERAKRRGVSVFENATGGTGRYGAQSGPRPVATSRDPSVRHYRVVLALLDGGVRGIARGATRYFDPKTQLALWEQGRTHHPLTVLDRWTYNRPWSGPLTRDDKGRQQRELGPPGDLGGQEEWVGPIDGVDAWELMLMRRRTTADAQATMFAEAREVIESRGRDQELGGAATALAAGAALLGMKVLL